MIKSDKLVYHFDFYYTTTVQCLICCKYDLFISVLRQFGSLEDLIEYIEMTF